MIPDHFDQGAARSLLQHPLPPRSGFRLLLSRKKGKRWLPQWNNWRRSCKAAWSETVVWRSALRALVAEAGPGDITFIESERFVKLLKSSPASAAIVGPHFNLNRQEAEQTLTVIEVDDPMAAFLTVRTHLNGGTAPRWTGVHPQSWVAPTARIGQDVAIYPFAYVGDGATIADGTTAIPRGSHWRSLSAGT